MRPAALALALVGLCAPGTNLGTSAHAGDPAANLPAGVRYSDVSGRLAVADAPLWLHVRFEADGRLALRSALAAVELEWVERGAWRLDGEGAHDLASLSGLTQGLIAAHGGDSALPGLRAEDGHSRAVLVLDADATVPWRHLQWAFMTAGHPRLKVWRLAFLSPGCAAWVDLRLPRDDEGASGPLRVWREVTVILFRKGTAPGDGPVFTRLRLKAEERAGDPLDVVEEDPLEPEQDWVAPEAPIWSATIDLPAVGAPSGVHAAVWREVARALEAQAATPLRYATLDAPLPVGPLVPSADAIEALLRLHEAGFERIFVEGTSLPGPAAQDEVPRR